jgi:hypothetical protein
MIDREPCKFQVGKPEFWIWEGTTKRWEATLVGKKGIFGKVLTATPLNGLDGDRACRRAFLNWEKDYWLARAHNDLQVSATSFPLDGAAYQYAISQPPSEKNHPLWSTATAREKDERGRKTRRPLFSWRTTSTTLQLAVDHAFTGSYAKRFCPLDPPPSLRCPCGHPLRSPHHIIRDCRLYYLQRVGHRITANGRTLPLKTLFLTTTQLAHHLLSFIADSRAAMRPPEIGRWVNIPPEPD